MSPYRPLPVLPERKPMAVCAWCRYSNPLPWTWDGVRLCFVKPDPVDGFPGKSPKNDGTCPDYQPTLFTRLAWWRRAWL